MRVGDAQPGQGANRQRELYVRGGGMEHGLALGLSPKPVRRRQILGPLELPQARGGVVLHRPVFFRELEDLRKDLKEVVGSMPPATL